MSKTVGKMKIRSYPDLVRGSPAVRLTLFGFSRKPYYMPESTFIDGGYYIFGINVK